MDGATREERDGYAKQGFFTRQAVFEQAELEPLRDAMERIHERMLTTAARDDAPRVDRIDGKRYQELLGSTVKWEWREGVAEIRSMEPCRHLDPRLEALVDDARLWGPARSLIGTESVSLFSDKLNFKRPAGAPFPWHQESPYWVFGGREPERIVSVLIYLDAATQENGCLWVIPGSHRSGMLPCFQERGTLGRLYTDVDRLDGEAPLPIEGPAGSVLFFHAHLVHGSQSNRSDRPRRTLLLAYQPPGLSGWRRGGVRRVGVASSGGGPLRRSAGEATPKRLA